jgi:hypothetical protein
MQQPSFWFVTAIDVTVSILTASSREQLLLHLAAYLKEGEAEEKEQKKNVKERY